MDESEWTLVSGFAMTTSSLPPLENGDRLTRAEFERRYEAMPRLKRAELVEGVVFVGGRVRYDAHGVPHACVAAWLGYYRAFTAGTSSATNTSVRLDLENEFQPDVILRISHGGSSRISADDFVEGAPELAAEVASSSASYELHDKLRAYCRNGLQEYIVWRFYDSCVDWFVLRDGEYERLESDQEGVMRSEVFPGLWLSLTALLRGDGSKVLATLQEGLASPEHAAFVERLQVASREQARQPDA
jgi:Uma2 family endonuclease